MNFPRSSGILLHPTCLPSRFGIGDFGPAAYRFADFLENAGQRIWQMLPLNPPGYENSPYQCLSTFAGNPFLISPDRLVTDDLLQPSDLEIVPPFPENAVDFDQVNKFKTGLLRRSFYIFNEKSPKNHRQQFSVFCDHNASWLDTYALFMALKEHYHFEPWHTWETAIKRREADAIDLYKNNLKMEIQYHKYTQYLFFKQWLELKKYCNNLGIRIMGDIPIYVALDSDTVWSHPDQFHLNANGKPTIVAGVPPDYFCKTGQLWGNPIYRWEKMAEDGYSWWIERVRRTHELFDIIRLDHFRAFEKYWEIPATHKTAMHGCWAKGTGASLFHAIENTLGPVPFVAEDLGDITPEVIALRDQLGLPGLKVLQFAFGDDSPDNPHRPENYPHHCVVYTGTHDNNTTIGWFQSSNASDTTQGKKEKLRERERALKYLGTDGTEINWDFIRLALSSIADTAITPLQDIMGLGSEARMNLPGTPKDNWRWRFTQSMLTDDLALKMGALTRRYNRS